MVDLWAVAGPILVLDIANPVLLAAVILSMTSAKPYANTFALITAHTLSYTIVGFLVVYGVAELLELVLSPAMQRLQNPEPEDFVIGLLVGLLLIRIALRWKTDPPHPSDAPPKPSKSGPVAAFMFGGVVSFVGIPFAIPYFAFVNQLMKIDGPLVPANLVLYNLLYAVPFLMVPAAVALFGRSAMPVLERINKAVERYAAYIMPGLLGVAGLVLVADALTFFITGQGLI
ncbi:MAG: GAP family protein [Rhodobacteraceae bacterium]|nr:GAP family protein [Paracoccaceae bacterium]